MNDHCITSLSHCAAPPTKITQIFRVLSLGPPSLAINQFVEMSDHTQSDSSREDSQEESDVDTGTESFSADRITSTSASWRQSLRLTHIAQFPSSGVRLPKDLPIKSCFEYEGPKTYHCVELIGSKTVMPRVKVPCSPCPRRPDNPDLHALLTWNSSFRKILSFQNCLFQTSPTFVNLHTRLMD